MNALSSTRSVNRISRRERTRGAHEAPRFRHDDVDPGLEIPVPWTSTSTSGAAARYTRRRRRRPRRRDAHRFEGPRPLRGRSSDVTGATAPRRDSPPAVDYPRDYQRHQLLPHAPVSSQNFALFHRLPVSSNKTGRRNAALFFE